MVKWSRYLIQLQVIWNDLRTLTLKWLTYCLTIYFLRTGNWKGHLEVLFDFLPYCFCLNCQNYARNLSYYYVHMRALDEKNIAAYKYLEKGGFSSSLTGKGEPRIPFYQVIVTTIKR